MYAPGTGIIINELECSTAEHHLLECNYKYGRSSCTHADDAGIQCMEGGETMQTNGYLVEAYSSSYRHWFCASGQTVRSYTTTSYIFHYSHSTETILSHTLPVIIHLLLETEFSFKVVISYKLPFAD